MPTTDSPVILHARRAAQAELAWFDMMMERKQRGRTRGSPPMRVMSVAAAAAAHSLKFFNHMMEQKEA